ncbi:MAG: DUF1156 domain-containing protein [Clostridiales bacterium]|jgi:adenine-specific DNA methylase|nr:DUF1156 domain-containing protein [Clostridiales bacterium]
MTTAFIEKQFPVSKLSKESHKERKAAQSQTITGLGKWWGRKPLVLVRAAILGCLMPASDNPRRDMETFLKVMSMDENGVLERSDKSALDKWVRDELGLSAVDYRALDAGEKDKLRKKVFAKRNYDARISIGLRPEQYERPQSGHAWNEINHHLGTHAYTLPDLMRQLSEKRFGKNAVVGDCFCGGGSVPFEAARMGLDVYASDLNPIAGLLTWASINICGASEEEITEIKKFQQDVYNAVDKEITELGIEHNERGDRALSYIYCSEVVCPECGVAVPLMPSLVVGKRAGSVVAKLRKNGNHYDIDIISDASSKEMKEAESSGTAKSNALFCPNCGKSTPITVLRGDRKDDEGNTVYGLRQWGKSEFEPCPDNVYQERLYAIRYEKASDGNGRAERYYRAPNERDLANEEKVRQIVKENIAQWQAQGFVPDSVIEQGVKTKDPLRERGWTYWHHLFNPRQLLVISYYVKESLKAHNKKCFALGLLGVNKCANFASKLSRLDINRDAIAQTFYNQAFNAMMNYGVRSAKSFDSFWLFNIERISYNTIAHVKISDARIIEHQADIWLTDPPYADAIMYHELSEFFLAWDKRLLKEAFPDWYADSKRVLAVRGGEGFAQSMIDIYSNLTNHMPDDGMQVVMFTHSDPAVWAQLALIMWKAGLKVTAAWNIATETDASGLKNGNYVKGTVLLVLRKRTGTSEAFLDEINADIKAEVVSQIESMQTLDDKDAPNFADPDYVLAAYAASLKALTSYSSIGEIDLDYELDKAINDPKNSKVVALIERAKKQAYDCIIPTDFDSYLWKELTSAERFYIKGLENEKNGGYQISAYQEYARGFAISSYSQLMANERANTCRLKTPQEFAMRRINEVPGFEGSALRLILAAIHIAIKEDEKPGKGLWHLKNSLTDYWGSRDMLRQLLSFLKDTGSIDNMPHWKEAAQMAEHIYVLVDNDHV